MEKLKTYLKHLYALKKGLISSLSYISWEPILFMMKDKSVSRSMWKQDWDMYRITELKLYLWLVKTELISWEGVKINLLCIFKFHQNSVLKYLLSIFSHI